MGRKEQIIKSLMKSPKTASEISGDLKLNTQDVRTYLQRLKFDNKIKEIDKDGREFVYDVIEKKEKPKVLDEYIKAIGFLNSFYKEHLDHLLKSKKIADFIIKNDKIFEEIEELLTK